MPNLSPDLLKACFEHGMETYPEEACGLISGSVDPVEQVSTIHRMRNLMDTFHAQDPQLYPRTNRNAYMIDPLEQMKLGRQLKKQGDRIKIIYHTHPDVGAYFSKTDQADALWNGEPRYPEVSYLVCGITQGQPDGAILVTFNLETRLFDVVRLC